MPVLSIGRNLDNEPSLSQSFTVSNSCFFSDTQAEIAAAATRVLDNTQLAVASSVTVVPSQLSTTSKVCTVFLNATVEEVFKRIGSSVWYLMVFIAAVSACSVGALT